MQQQPRQMRWIFDQLSRRRINDEVMATARMLMPMFLQQCGGNVKKAARLSMQASYALVNEFVRKELI